MYTHPYYQPEVKKSNYLTFNALMVVLIILAVLSHLEFQNAPHPVGLYLDHPGAGIDAYAHHPAPTRDW